VQPSSQSPQPHTPASALNRRDALVAAGTAGVIVTGGMRAVHGQTPSADLIRVGVVGTGGRGSGALKQTLSVPGSNVKVTAVADAFGDRIQSGLKAVKDLGDKVDVPEDRRFEGLDGWKRVLDHCDMVILATPPGFRPFHFQAAVEAGKHVFMEKPVCVDSYGARLCLETAKKADEKGLKVVVGLQRRYENSYRAALARVREGLIGDIVAGEVYWNCPGIWYRTRKPDTTEMQFQINNWYHFAWLGGDHICEQHVHNIDVANWFLDRLPQSAYGVGGRQNRVPGQSSEIYDHHSVTFAYPGGVRIASQCEQIPGGDSRVEEHFRGTKGLLEMRPGRAVITDLDGKELWKFAGPNPDPYQVEHDALHEAIRQNKPLNNAHYGTTSSFSAVLGRLATYSGKEWNYDDAMQLDFRTMPETVAWDSEPPTLPDANGDDRMPMPATFKVRSVTKPAVS
jgi:myo-inositol 2-dehydrogenase/D-chiro-inositol 1-dehydrogenase